MNDPLISIIVPAYNAAPFLEEAIASVLDQTWVNWELIIVDDGSTDETPAILARYGDPRIKVLRQDNAGVGAARNAALDLASGDFVTFLDADDRLPPDALLLRAEYLRAHAQVDIVNGRIRIMGMGETLSTYTPSTAIARLLPHLAALDAAVFFGPFYMLRRSCVGSIRFPIGMTHCEDLCFFLELADRADLVYGAVDAEIYEYRKHDSSAMTNLDGIEAGYLALIGFASRLERMTTHRVFALRCRVSSIMLKSWFRKGRPLRAGRALFRIWAMVG